MSLTALVRFATPVRERMAADFPPAIAVEG
jgi:hypothetical protein